MSIWSIILIVSLTAMDRQFLSEKEIVTVSVNETFVAPGKKTFAVIQVKVKEGYHIQADKVNDESLIPVSLKVTKDKHFNIGTPIFPAYKLFRLEGTDNSLNVFDSIFIIRMPIKASAMIKDGKYILRAKLRYQACDTKTCLFPRTREFDIPIVAQKL
jgi:hypothetical protein